MRDSLQMSKMRIFSVVGARPQFVKAAIVSQALEKYPDVEHAIVHTGQHYDQNMSDVFFEELGMPAPAFNLHISARCMMRTPELTRDRPPPMCMRHE